MGLAVSILVGSTPDGELAQATSVEVYERMAEATTYRIRYEVDIFEGDLPFLVDGRIDPGTDLSILVPIDDSVVCLAKGPVHGQQIRLEHGGAGSWVEVKGSDTSIVMDRETQSVVWADVTDSDAVTSILGKYGYTPDVEATNGQHLENNHTLVQRESDLRFVRRLARRNGFLFWVTCDAFGVEQAHFKRPPLEGTAASELIINFDSPSLQALDLTWDVERPTSVEALQLDLNTAEDLVGAVATTPQSILGDRSLQAITGDTRSVHVFAPTDDAGNLLARGEGTLIEADWFLRGSCETSLEALGFLVRSHTVMELRGAGSRYSGTYFVAGVRHSIDTTSHRMEVELVRNAWSG